MQHSFPAWNGWLGRKRLQVYATAQNALDQSLTPEVTFAVPDASNATIEMTKLELPATAIHAGELLPLSI